MTTVNNLFEYTKTGNIDGVKKCINNGISIYSRTGEHETALYFAATNGHAELANYIWNIYENDLQFIERSISSDNKSWLNGPIGIGLGNKNIDELEKLYSEYQNCECVYISDKTKCVVFLLKLDNFICTKVLCLSPISLNGCMLTLAMLKCVIPNGFLNVNTANTCYGRITKQIPLIRTIAASGFVNIFEKLLAFGADLNKMKLIRTAFKFSHLNILDTIYKRFPFRMYDLLMSTDYNWFMFQNDNWPIFKYVVERCIAETQYTWKEIINSIVAYNQNESFTVFQMAVVKNCLNIAEHCLPFGPDVRKCPLLQINYIPDTKESQNLLLKIIKLDPIHLKRIFNTLFNYTNFPYINVPLQVAIVYTVNADTLQEIGKRYPFIWNIFFKNCLNGKIYFDDLLLHNQQDKIKLLLANCIDHVDMETFIFMVTSTVAAGYEDLFFYLISLREFDFTLLPLDRIVLDTIKNCNVRILNMILSKVNYNLNVRSPGILHKNLLHYLIKSETEQSKNENLLSKMFNKLVQVGINYVTNYNIYNDGTNLLHIAVARNKFYVTKKLLELGVEMNVYDSFGNLPIHYATSVNTLELLNTWTPKSYINVKAEMSQMSLLHLNRGDDDFIKYLLDNGGNINAVDEKGRSPIFYVKSAKAAKLLLEYKPNLNLLDITNQTALMHFISESFMHEHDIVDILYQHELNTDNSPFWINLERKCNTRSKENLPFLIQTLRTCRQCTGILLELQNLNVFVTNRNGNTPVHESAELCDVELCERFIEKGLSIDDRNSENDTAFHLYCKTGRFNYEDFMRFLKLNPDIDARGNRDTSPIWWITKHAPHEYMIICELLSRGANILDMNRDGDMAYDNLLNELQQVFYFLK